MTTSETLRRQAEAKWREMDLEKVPPADGFAVNARGQEIGAAALELAAEEAVSPSEAVRALVEAGARAGYDLEALEKGIHDALEQCASSTLIDEMRRALRGYCESIGRRR